MASRLSSSIDSINDDMKRLSFADEYMKKKELELEERRVALECAANLLNDERKALISIQPDSNNVDTITDSNQTMLSGDNDNDESDTRVLLERAMVIDYSSLFTIIISILA